MKKKYVGAAIKLFSLYVSILFVFIGLFTGCAKDPKVAVTADETIAAKFDRYTVTGITTPLPQAPDVTGFIGASFMQVGDLDGDGKKEIVCTSGIGLDGDYKTSDGAVAVFKQGADLGTWTKGIIYPDNATGLLAFPNETLLRDMDGDNITDIMVMDNFMLATIFPGGIYYLKNLGGDVTDKSNWELKTIYRGDPLTLIGRACYHRARFLDVDGDGLEDIVTSKVSMDLFMGGVGQYAWVEWWKKNNDGDPTSYSGPYTIGDGGGFQFVLVDVDGDGNLDVVAPQFFITNPLTLEVKDPDDIHGDSLAWFKNPGPAGAVTGLWDRYTIDNWYTSKNPLGKNFEVILADIDNDGEMEIIDSNHNHQDYRPTNDPSDSSNHRIWPSGIYYFGIPKDPTVTKNWKPITIDRGDPKLDPTDADAVAADPYTVDRPGGPYGQGSPGMVRAADINGDGYPDLVVSGDGKGAVYYYESQGKRAGKLRYKRCALYKDPACMPGEPQIADMDNDGKLEIVQVIYDTSVAKDSKSGSIFIFKLKP